MANEGLYGFTRFFRFLFSISAQTICTEFSKFGKLFVFPKKMPRFTPFYLLKIKRKEGRKEGRKGKMGHWWAVGRLWVGGGWAMCVRLREPRPQKKRRESLLSSFVPRAVVLILGCIEVLN